MMLEKSWGLSNLLTRLVILILFQRLAAELAQKNLNENKFLSAAANPFTMYGHTIIALISAQFSL
jgi:hypothetical protein